MIFRKAESDYSIEFKQVKVVIYLQRGLVENALMMRFIFLSIFLRTPMNTNYLPEIISSIASVLSSNDLFQASVYH